jgi:hypothetical protein
LKVAPLGPVAGAYYLDNSPISIIEGPVGSAKSTASCLKLQRFAYEQVPGPDGVGRSWFGIVRNTKPQLRDTTMKTWFNVFPPSVYGEYHATDSVHEWKFTPQGHPWPIHAHFQFLALDDPDDVRKLLSLEVTGFWLNECREIIEDITGHLRGRTRYLGGERPHTWHGWIGDTNPWDTEHYLEDRLSINPREGWKHFRQPGGLDPEAENLENLEQTAETLAMDYDDPRRREQGRKYYLNLLQDYSKEDAEVYVHAKRGATRDGRPIYTDYNDRLHCIEFQLDPRLPLDIGIDFGRTPAATIGQEFAGGATQIAYELVTEDMGLAQFGEELARMLRSPELARFGLRNITGDPSGEAKDAHDETVFQILKGAGLDARPAKTNEPSVRIETVNKGFRTLSGGKPALLIHPRCKVLRRACIDGYRYKRLKVAGERYSDQPDKNKYSHIAEALQYHLLGLGHGVALLRGDRLQGHARPRYTLT